MTRRGWPCVQAPFGSTGVSDRAGREREGPVAAGRPLAQMSPGRGGGLLLYFAQGPTGHYGARLAVSRGKPGFSGAVGGSGAGPHALGGEIKEEGAAAGRRRGTFAGKGMGPSARPTDGRAWKASTHVSALPRIWEKNKKNGPLSGPVRSRRSGEPLQPDQKLARTPTENWVTSSYACTSPTRPQVGVKLTWPPSVPVQVPSMSLPSM